jgi:hypothetical protein
MEAAFLVGVIFFGVVMWALMLWTGIALVDRRNPRNEFMTAIAWSLVQLMFVLPMLAASTGPRVVALGYSPALLIVLACWCTSLLLVLVAWYRIGILSAIAVVAAVVFGPFSLVSLLERLAVIAGDDHTVGLAILYGVPACVLLAWRANRRRGAQADPAPSLPAARVIRH